MLAYLAHPIDLHGDDEHLYAEMLPKIIGDLNSELISVYCPSNAFQVADTHPEAFVARVNNFALDQADVVVAVWPESKTIGTVLELARAIGAGKPTVIVSNRIASSWSLAGLEYSHVYVTDKFGGDEVEWLLEMARITPPAVSLPSLKYTYDSPEMFVSNYGPRVSYKGDAGFDLFVSEDTEIPAGQFKDVPCGISVELPEGVWAMITGRSSTLRKHNLLVTMGIIDQGYRGPLYAGVYNMNGEQFTAVRGMRLAQLIPFPLTAAGMAPRSVPELSPSDRGAAGFGSTGV